MKKRQLVEKTNVGQQQRAYMIYHANVLLWKLGDTGDIFWGIVKGVIWHGDFDSGGEKILHIVECLLNSQPATLWNNQNYS
jgi:hypothetical protein